MKGLLIRDLRNMWTMKISILLIFVVDLFAVFQGAKDMVILLMGFNVITFGLFAAATMTYDNMDNGWEYMFTMPITRKLYVLEKYLFTFIIMIISSILSFVALFIYTNSVKEALGIAVIMCIVAIIMQIIYIPLSFKYGAENAKFYRMIVMWGVGCLAGLIYELSLNTKLGVRVLNIVSKIGIIAWVIIGIIILIAIIGVSIKISIKVMEKKDL